MIFASFYVFPVVERARNMYYVGLPVLSNVLCWASRPTVHVYIETRYETDGVSWPDVRRTQLVHFFRETFGFYLPKPPYTTGPWGVPRVK